MISAVGTKKSVKLVGLVGLVEVVVVTAHGVVVIHGAVGVEGIVSALCVAKSVLILTRSYVVEGESAQRH